MSTLGAAMRKLVHVCFGVLKSRDNYRSRLLIRLERSDGIYVRVGCKWKYLLRAVDKHGQPIDFMLSDQRDTGAAYRFLRKALKMVRDYPLSSISTDKLASYPKAIRRSQSEGLLAKDAEHRTSKYLNSIVEADHGALKCMIRPTHSLRFG